MKHEAPIPPRWPDRFLGWYCNATVREQVQGDAHELFYWRLEEKGLQRARRAFLWDVIRLFKWSNFKRSSQQLNHIAMFKNYFKIGLRNLWKQKMPSTINIIGLSLAVGCCIVSFKWIESKFVTDRFHEKLDEIYLVTPEKPREDGGTQRWGRTALAISELLESQIPGVENVVRHHWAGVELKVNGNDFNTTAVFVDGDFFELFTFKTLLGDASAMKDPRKVVINEAKAEAYFGDDHPIGQQIEVMLNGNMQAFEVAGVVANAPENSSIRPGLMVNFEVFERNKDKLTTSVHTFIELNPSTDLASLEEPLAELAKTKTNLTPERPYESLVLEPLRTMSSTAGQEVWDSLGGSPPMAPVIVLSCIGGFLLLLSTFNYVNIATMMAMKRVKEIGVRKVIGSRRGHLIVQFLTENLILCTLAIFIGCLLASALFLPGFNGIAGGNLTLDLLSHQNLWLFLGGLLVFITLASGAYPAFYISSFKPVTIFRGHSAKGGKRRLTGALLTFQMTLAVLTIVAGIMFVRTNTKNESRDWGYDQYNKLVTGLPKGQSMQTMKAELAQLANVEEVSASLGVLGQNYRVDNFKKEERKVDAYIIDSDYNYPEMMGLELVSGQFFQKETAYQNQRSIMVNETFVRSMGYEGEELDYVTLDSTTYAVAGVLKDYHYANFSDIIRPAVIRVMPDSLLRSITVKIVPGTVIESKESVVELLDRLDPERDHYVSTQDSVFDSHFEEARGITSIMIFTASLSVLLAAMGLFGLVSLSISSRIKDFGIKKVLGAGMFELSKDVYKRFALIIGLAFILGSTFSILVIGILLDSVYGYHDAVGPIPLILSGLLLMAVAAFTINTQIIQVRRMNPANTLRTE